MDSCNNRREPAMQVCPVAAKIPDTAPLSASSMTASSNTMLGDLPPSSSPTFLKPRAAVSAMILPVVSDPVNVIFAVSGCSTSGMPASLPYPVTTLTTPAGKPACSTSLTTSMLEADGKSEGLVTTGLPAARGGATFQAVSISGEFHGVIATTTPSGS